MLLFEDAAAWEAWLAAHHDSAPDAWLLIAKSRSARVSVTIEQALRVALCFGWIDSQRRSHDQDFYRQRYSRRRRGGSWSLDNVRRVEELTAAGRMRPAGLAEVEAARRDGRWAAAYPNQREAVPPDDLVEALAASPTAAARFEALDRTARYQIILSLWKARTAAGRAARLRAVVADLTAG
jgi:uncharacterized protein YdeI (YjbR/CyaY-like superfamily)